MSDIQKKDIYHLTNGDLSKYALHCGYIQRKTFEDGSEITLWQEGGNCYHVRRHHPQNGRIFWYASWLLSDCRKVFKRGSV